MSATPASAPRAPIERTDDPARWARWAFVALWVVLPVGAGPAFDAALHGHTTAVQRTASVVLWAAWLGGVVCGLVPRTTSLTTVRTLAPAVPAALVVALATAAPGTDVGTASVSAGLALGTAAAGLSLTAWVGHAFVNGSAYGDERRFLLRPPAALLFGPIELAWLILVALPTTGAILMAREAFVAGGVLLAVSVPAGYVILRALHGQVRRWLVLVPAGVVVHDAAALVDNMLLPRRIAPRLSAALSPPVGTDGSTPVDLTLGAAGLAVQVDVREPVPITARPRQRPGSGAEADTVERTALLISPTRPGLLLRSARFGPEARSASR